MQLIYFIHKCLDDCKRVFNFQWCHLTSDSDVPPLEDMSDLLKQVDALQEKRQCKKSEVVNTTSSTSQHKHVGKVDSSLHKSANSPIKVGVI